MDTKDCAGATQSERVKCCIVGGGPAGIMAGFLLARQRVDVLVLEKHKDFFRDFRGDTIHPSTLELMSELGLLDEFLHQKHSELREITVHFGSEVFHIADLKHLPTKCKFVALMPQWDFLNFLSSHAKKYPNFRLRMETEVTELLFQNNRVVGVCAKAQDGPLEVCADLVIGADDITGFMCNRVVQRGNIIKPGGKITVLMKGPGAEFELTFDAAVFAGPAKSESRNYWIKRERAEPVIIPDVSRFGEKNKATAEQGWEDVPPGSSLEGLLLPVTTGKNGEDYRLLKVITQPATPDQIARLGNDRAPVVHPSESQGKITIKS